MFSKRLITVNDVLMRPVEDESVFLNLNSDKYFGLDDVGTRFWQVLTASDTVEAAFKTLCEEYDAAPEELRRDLVALVETLVHHGLARLEDP